MAITWGADVREENAADLIQWISFMFSLGMSAFYLREIKYGVCGWEVAYIAVVETIKYIVELGWEEESPASIYLTNGNVVPWIRYVEWLSTCPGAAPNDSACDTKERTPRGKHTKHQYGLLQMRTTFE